MEEIDKAFTEYIASIKNLSADKKEYFCMCSLNELLKVVNELSLLTDNNTHYLKEMANIRIDNNKGTEEFLDDMLIYIEQIRLSLMESKEKISASYKGGEV